MKRKIVIAVASAAALLGGSTIAVAAIPDTNTGTFTACVASSGNLLSNMRNVYMIDKQAGDRCNPGYVEKQWNQTGPAGPQGIPGPQGPAGTPAKTPYLHKVVDTATYGTPYEIRWAECPAGSVILSALATNDGWYISYDGSAPYPTHGPLQLWDYSDTGVSYRAGFEITYPNTPDPGPNRYYLTLKCQEM